MTGPEPAPDQEAGPPEVWQPPWWLLVFAPFGWLLLGAVLLDRRGVAVTVVALVLLAPVGLPVPAVLRSLRERFGAVHLGPLAFALSAGLTSWPLGWCVALGVAVLAVAAVAGVARDRR